MNQMIVLSRRKFNLQETIRNHKEQKLSYHQTGDIKEWYETMEYLESRLRDTEEKIKERCCELRGATSK